MSKFIYGGIILNKLKRIFAMLLISVLILGILPTGVLAFASTSEENSVSPGTEQTAPSEAVPFDVGEPAPEAEESEPSQADNLDAGEPSPMPDETDQPDTTPPADDPADEPSSGQDDLAAPPIPEVAANDGESNPTPEPTDESSPEPTTEPTPEPTAEPSPEPTVEPTPTAKPHTGRNILPDPIPGYDPLDPSNPYPYGEPVDNFYPPEFDVEDPNGIILMSQGSIPDSMWDNSILRALAYTGFNVQKLKDNNWLYKYEYISTNLPSHDSSILSDIGYGEYPNGDETVSDGSTPTGKAPNIPYFESNGLVCASFVNYYVNNYLRNIEGVDTSAISSALGKVGTSVRVVSTWVSALTSLASDPNSDVTRYTSADTAYANLVPGDIIAFKNDSGTWMHLAVYAGTYTLYRTSGSSIGTYHFIIHVGNDCGPEISTAEFMANAGAKSSKPAEWYHLSFNTTQKGDLKIVKTSDDGNVSGITFTVQGGSVNQTVQSGADGTITVPGLIPGTYTVTEQVSESYVCDHPTQTVSVEYDRTTTVYFKNTLKKWRITVVKEDAEGDVARYGDATLAGAVYGIYKDGQLQKTYTTDENHSFTTDYYVCGSGWTLREITASPGYTVDPTVYEIGAEPGDFTIAANSLDLSVPEHIIKGTLVILKQDEEDQHPLEGAIFHVFDELGAKVAEATTGPDGKATFPDLQYGEYTYQEIVPPKYFELDENTYDFSILEDGKTITLTRDDTRIPGSITVHKNDTRGNDLSGAEYLLEWSTDGRSWKPVESRPDTPPVKTGFCTSPGLSSGRLTTGSDGTVTFSGLRADGEIQYRLTETKAPAGMELLKDPVYTGTLPVEGRDDLIYDISYTVTDNRITELPHTGASGFDPVTFGTVLTGLAGCAGIFITQKSKRRNAQ